MSITRHIQLPNSNIKGKKPSPSDIKYGEIAVNYNKDNEFLSIKNSEGAITTFISSAQTASLIKEKQITVDSELSETSKNPVQNSAITKVILDDEKVMAAHVNKLYDVKLDSSAYTEYHLSAATATKLGGVKVGEGLYVSADGTISVTGGSGAGGSDGVVSGGSVNGFNLVLRRTNDLPNVNINVSSLIKTIDSELSSSSTNSVQNAVITQRFINDEEVTAAGLNDLNDRKVDSSANTYVTDAYVDGTHLFLKRYNNKPDIIVNLSSVLDDVNENNPSKKIANGLRKCIIKLCQMTDTYQTKLGKVICYGSGNPFETLVTISTANNTNVGTVKTTVALQQTVGKSGLGFFKKDDCLYLAAPSTPENTSQENRKDPIYFQLDFAYPEIIYNNATVSPDMSSYTLVGYVP